jgi:magnesium chelatase subunit I
MKHTTIQTLGELKQAGYTPKTMKEELRANLIKHMERGSNPFKGIIGYDETVLPDVQRAILSGHSMNLLGLRGQAKTRIARTLTELLDEWIPCVAGSELNDDPMHPISRTAHDLLETHGDLTPIRWMHRSERYVEKLATPDVSVADLIGDIDPIKAANLKLHFADERVLHYGIIPRSNRCIFVINELPDLQARIQVALFNILQEGDIQIRGFKLRMNLDIQFIFTANPEDYTNRGSIVTPLKDRIGSQILTHYPKNIAVAKKITEQEARLNPTQKDIIYVPNLAKDIIEQISFEARESEYIDAKSGVSARMTISAMENLISTAERRCLKNGLKKTSVRLSDFMGIIPAITGKIELVYEGEQEGAEVIATHLIEKAINTLFKNQFPKISKIEKQNERNAYSDLLDWFIAEGGFELYEDFDEKQYNKILDEVKPLDALIKKYAPDTIKEDVYFMKEFILWALVENKKLNKERLTEGFSFKDILGHLINKM